MAVVQDFTSMINPLARRVPTGCSRIRKREILYTFAQPDTTLDGCHCKPVLAVPVHGLLSKSLDVVSIDLPC